MTRREHVVTAIRHSALDGLHAEMERASELAIREVPYATQICVRMDAESAPAVEACLGVAVPRTPGTWTMGEPAVLQLGPDEWLIVAERDPTLEARMHTALTTRRDAIVDVSDLRTTIELTGPRAGEVLATSCSLDLHPRTFGPGRCAQTVFARAGVILLRVDDATFRLLLDRSYAVHVVTWVLDAMIGLVDGGAEPVDPTSGARRARSA
jgi:sarcosine oxidase, subunit gamma